MLVKSVLVAEFVRKMALEIMTKIEHWHLLLVVGV